jgi:hypothetical protein
MRNDRNCNYNKKKISIRREENQGSPILRKSNHQGVLGQDRTIPVRRHSVIVNNVRQGGSINRISLQKKIIGEQYEKMRSKDLIQFQSYQSSK